jgi:D-lyxose ketol-isomerase
MAFGDEKTKIDHDAEAAQQAEVTDQVVEEQPQVEPEEPADVQPVDETDAPVDGAVYDADDIVEVSLPADAVGLDGQELVAVVTAGVELKPGDSVEVTRSVALAVAEDERVTVTEVSE